jgi:hypothetical protein
MNRRFAGGLAGEGLTPVDVSGQPLHWFMVFRLSSFFKSQAV